MANCRTELQTQIKIRTDQVLHVFFTPIPDGFRDLQLHASRLMVKHLEMLHSDSVRSWVSAVPVFVRHREYSPVLGSRAEFLLFWCFLGAAVSDRVVGSG